MLYNYHTHTPRCHHAEGTEEDFVRDALVGGYRVLGFSDHTPMPFPTDYRSGHRMAVEETADYFRAIEEVRKKYKDRITIYRGVEVEYYPKVFPDLMKLLSDYPLDYMILGQHFIHNEYDDELYIGDATANPQYLKDYVDQVIEALEIGCFAYLAHPDLPRFVGDDTVWQKEMTRLCLACKEMKMPLEINLLGLWQRRHYPSDRFFKLAGEIGNDIVIGVDAHSPDRLSEGHVVAEAMKWVKKYNLKLLEEVTLPDPFKAWNR